LLILRFPKAGKRLIVDFTVVQVPLLIFRDAVIRLASTGGKRFRNRLSAARFGPVRPLADAWEMGAQRLRLVS